MYTHYKHCHRVTAHLQLNIIIIINDMQFANLAYMAKTANCLNTLLKLNAVKIKKLFNFMGKFWIPKNFHLEKKKKGRTF